MIAPHLLPSFAPQANPNAIVHVPNLRVTVLTSRLLRIEYNPTNTFEDRPSQAFWHRQQPVPEFDVVQDESQLQITTSHLQLVYKLGHPLSAESLTISLREHDHTWHYGDSDTDNLMGTFRTLDAVDGKVKLEQGLLSRAGWVVVDDSRSLVFDSQGWLTPHTGEAKSEYGIRNTQYALPAAEDSLDLYFFGYGRDFIAALTDFRKIAGPVPLLPKWALGNWWSRYWEYTHDELTQLIRDFEQHEIPLSVCIIDMDWHITQTGNTSAGWTGYTWNRELFPNPQATLDFIHEHGLKTALNLHPASGIHPHEEQYPAFARWMGLNPNTRYPIPFDIADPHFTRAYLELLHHPYEKMGIDFWWMDWQQGQKTTLAGLDPLWWLNHLHFYDLARPTPPPSPLPASGEGETGSPPRAGGLGGVKRPFIFSRWGGLGNHRYPIGFSGDTIITWDSLAFQPYFTSTAANVGYGWWSHDIGGHFGGIEDPELYTRWVQYGLLSPILRLHSTKNRFLERRPFGWDAETLHLTGHAMQLRHRFIPYLYSMSWRDHTNAEPPVRPMYHAYPDSEEAYCTPDQYTFGSELLAAPYIHPRDPHTRLSRQVVWLPHEAWNFFTGQHYEPGWHALHGTLDDLPLFAKPGAIVPLCDWQDWRNPAHLEIHLFPGAGAPKRPDNHFDLYEDDGESTAFQNGVYALTPFTLKCDGNQITFNIQSATGNSSFLPPIRDYTLHFRGVAAPGQVNATLNGDPHPLLPHHNPITQTLTIPNLTLAPSDTLQITLNTQYPIPNTNSLISNLQSLVSAFRLDNTVKQVLYDNLPDIAADHAKLAAFRPALQDSHLRALLETITGAGLHHSTHTNEEILILWNNRAPQTSEVSERTEFADFGSLTYQLSTENTHVWQARDRFQVERGNIPAFKSLHPARDLKDVNWQVTLNYGDVLAVSYGNAP